MKLTDNTIISFPDGHKHLKAISGEYVWEHSSIEVAIKSFDDLFLLAQYKEVHPECPTLHIKYLLGARCDRKFGPYEACDLKIVAKFINDLRFDRVTILQPHSDVALTLIDRSARVEYNYDLLNYCIQDNNLSMFTLVAPDAGASKWVHDYKFDRGLIKVNYAQGLKTRNSNGEVAGISISGNIDEDCIILDDLCDGGATFIKLSKELREWGAKRIYLCVTHGIFSKGFEVFDGLIDGIYTTNSFPGPIGYKHIGNIKKVINVWM